MLDLPGCFASGDTLDELREALQEAIALYLIDDPEAATIHSMQNRERSAMRIDEMRVKVLAEAVDRRGRTRLRLLRVPTTAQSVSHTPGDASARWPGATVAQGPTAPPFPLPRRSTR